MNLQGKLSSIRFRTLAIGVINILGLAIGLYLNNTAIILISLILFSVVITISDYKLLLPLLLFFLPWSTVLKIQPNSFSFLTVIIPVILVVMIYRNQKLEFKLNIVLFISLFVSFTLLVKLFNNYAVETNYFSFVFLLFFLHFYILNYHDKISYEICVLYMSVGLILASIISYLLRELPHMALYYTEDLYVKTNVVNRFSGFGQDPNFFSAQILMTIAALLVLSSKTTKNSNLVIQFFTIITLIIIGFLSVSKMFLISILIILIVWLSVFIIQRRSYLVKMVIIIFTLLLISLLFSADTFSLHIEQYSYRFTTSSLTTGRSELQLMYLQDIFSNIGNLLTGNGLSQILLYERASHNTFIQILWQLGLIGVLMLLYWRNITFSSLMIEKHLNLVQSMYFIIILLAFFLPWMALDYIYFKEFFYYGLLLSLAKNYLKLKEV